MQEIQNIVSVKLLLGFIGTVLSCNIALIIFIAKKYIKRSEMDHEKLNLIDIKQIKKDHETLLDIRSEHRVFHKKELI